MMNFKKISLMILVASSFVAVNGFGMENEDSNKSFSLPVKLHKDVGLGIAEFIYDHPFLTVYVPFALGNFDSLMNKARVTTTPRTLAATFAAVVALKTASHYVIADKIKHDHEGLLFDYNGLLKKDTCRLFEKKTSSESAEKK